MSSGEPVRSCRRHNAACDRWEVRSRLSGARSGFSVTRPSLGRRRSATFGCRGPLRLAPPISKGQYRRPGRRYISLRFASSLRALLLPPRAAPLRAGREQAGGTKPWLVPREPRGSERSLRPVNVHASEISQSAYPLVKGSLVPMLDDNSRRTRAVRAALELARERDGAISVFTTLRRRQVSPSPISDASSPGRAIYSKPSRPPSTPRY